MGLICDACESKIPHSTVDKIVLNLMGKHGKLARKLLGDDKLVFCSIKCFEDYKFPNMEKSK